VYYDDDEMNLSLVELSFGGGGGDGPIVHPPVKPLVFLIRVI